MAKIVVNNPRQVINGGAKKYYFKAKGLGGPKGDKGDKGDTGATGPQGPQGNAATISVGSTTTLPVGQDASVENVGTPYNAVLNFGIPQGPQGPQGAKGEKGDTGTKGDTGAQGPQGTPGTNATIYIGTTTTGEPGTQASVYNSGTDSNAVLNFTIPRGDVGPQPELVQTTGTSTTKAMSQNATTNAINAGLAAKQNTLIAGANIQISSDTINATDTTYTAGNGLNLNGTEFSADTDILATKEDLEGYYPKTETDNLLAPKLEAEVVAELPTTGEEGKLYLTPKAHTTQTATGNPIEATVTEQAGQLESFQLDGDTFQQTYTGKNLCNLATFVKGRLDNGVLGYASNTTSLTVEGNSIAYTTNASYRGIVSAYIPVEPNTAYTLSRTVTSEITVSALIDAFESDSEAGWIERLLTATFTTPNNCHYVRISFQNYASGTATISNIMVEKSASATSFEPYVGGTPSPNPDYPQPIQTVTGEQTVTVVGKNLFDKTKVTNGYYIDENGALQASGNFGYSDYIPVIAGQTYTYSGATNSSSYAGKGAWYDANKQWLSSQSFGVSGRITAPSGAAYYRTTIRIAYSSNQEPYLDTYQLELGSTASSYTPYSKHTYEINLGKNLFDKNTDVLNGNYYLPGNIASTRIATASSSTMARTLLIRLQEGQTYTIQKKVSARFRFGFTTTNNPAPDTDGVITSRLAGPDTSASVTFTVPKGSPYFVCNFFSDDQAADAQNGYDTIVDSIQIEAGSQATAYAPYFTPIELCKLGDSQDYIWKDGDSWKVHKATNKITVDGSENWVYPDSGANYTFFQFSRDNFITKYGNAADFYASITEVGFAKADKFEQIVASSANMRTEQGIGFTTEGNGWFRISVANTIATTVNVFKTWLADHPTTAYYALAIATDTTITDSNLIAQLEAIRTASLQNGTNTITNTAAGSNLAGDMEIGYYGFAPRNRYDKWLWLDINNEYEQIGS